MISLMPDTDMLCDDAVQVEGLVRFIKARFQESRADVTQLFSLRPVETMILVKRVPDERLRLALLRLVVETQIKPLTQ